MIVVLISGIAAALIWGVLFFRQAGIWGVTLATLVLGTVFGYAFIQISVVTSDRLLLAVSLVAFVVYRYRGWLDRKQWTGTDLLFGIFLAAMILTTFLQDWRYHESAPLNKVLFFFLLPSGMYLLGKELTINATQIKWLYGVFALLGFYLAVTSCAERFDLRWAVFPRYINEPTIEEFLGRGRGPLLNPSGNGILLTLGLSCWLMFYPYVKRGGKAILICIVPIFLAGILCTMTRCVWIGGMLALGGIILMTMPKKLRMPSIVCTAMLGVLVLGTSVENLASFKRDKNVSEADMRQSAKLRPMLAIVAGKMFVDHPLLGCGTGQYLRVAGDYLSRRDVDLPMEQIRPYVQHNIFLSLLVENGLLATMPFIVLLIIWCRDAWRIWSNQTLELAHRQFGLVFLGFISGYLANGMFQDVLIIPMVNMYLFFLAGCVRSLTLQRGPARQPSLSSVRPAECRRVSLRRTEGTLR